MVLSAVANCHNHGFEECRQVKTPTGKSAWFLKEMGAASSGIAEAISQCSGGV